MGRVYTDPVEFFLDMAAESNDGKAHRDFPPSDALKEKWSEWRESVAKTMLDWGAENDLGDEVAKIIEGEDMFESDVYFTLGGHGVGIWDGRWDGYLSRANIKILENRLKKQLSRQHDQMEMAFHDEAAEHIERSAPRVHKMSLHGVQPQSLPSWARPPRRRS